MGTITRTIANNLTSGLGAGGGGLYTSIAHFQSHFDFTITTSLTAMDFGATEYISDANDFSIDTDKKIVTIANAGRYEINFTGQAIAHLYKRHERNLVLYLKFSLRVRTQLIQVSQ